MNNKLLLLGGAVVAGLLLFGRKKKAEPVVVEKPPVPGELDEGEEIPSSELPGSSETPPSEELPEEEDSPLVGGDYYEVGSRAILGNPHITYTNTIVTEYVKMPNTRWVTIPRQEEYFTSIHKFAHLRNVVQILGPDGRVVWSQMNDPARIAIG